MDERHVAGGNSTHVQMSGADIDHGKHSGPACNQVLRERSGEEIAALTIVALGTLAIVPFVGLHLGEGEWLWALLDSLALAVGAQITAIVWRHGSAFRFNLLLCVLCLGAMIVAVHSGGLLQYPWAYPAMLAAYFLVRPNLALALNCASTGALLPVLWNEPALLAMIDLVTLGVTIVLAYVCSRHIHNQSSALREQAHSDHLTCASNRRALEYSLRELIELHNRGTVIASLILFDIDRFKGINDSKGHAVGDAVLVEVAELAARRLRRTDVIYRLGGDEFVVVVTGADADTTQKLAENLRVLIETRHVGDGSAVATASFGVAEIEPDDAPAAWLQRADEALYEAKQHGRNQVVRNETIIPSRTNPAA